MNRKLVISYMVTALTIMLAQTFSLGYLVYNTYMLTEGRSVFTAEVKQEPVQPKAQDFFDACNYIFYPDRVQTTQCIQGLMRGESLDDILDKSVRSRK